MERSVGCWPIRLRNLPRHCIVVVLLPMTSSTPLIISGKHAGGWSFSRIIFPYLNLLLSSSHESRFMKVEPSPPQLYLARFCQKARVRTNLPYIPNFTWLIACSVSGKISGFIGRDPPCVSKSNRLHVDIFRFCLHFIKMYSVNYFKWITKFPEVLNLNQLSLKLNWFICNLDVGPPHSLCLPTQLPSRRPEKWPWTDTFVLAHNSCKI